MRQVRYCRLLEEGTFRGRTADFVYMILFGATMISCIAPFIRPSIPFLGSSLTFMMVRHSLSLSSFTHQV
jgi:Derlin-2/3